MIKKLKLTSEADTISFAQKIAPCLKPHHVLLLHGDLGAGKSCFCRALINALCDHDVEVPSPTFTLVQEYDTSIGDVWHMDLYRLEHPDEIYELGWDEALGEKLLLIEWPSRLEYLTPENAIHIKITIDTDQKTRLVELKAPEAAKINIEEI